MHRLWSDIDRARDRLGLRPGAAPPPTYGLTAMVGCLTEVATGVVSFVGNLSGLLPGSSAVAREVAACLDRIPVVGRLLATISGSFSRPAAR